MKQAIAILETIADSSVYGEAADNAYIALLGKTSVSDIHEVKINDVDVILRTLTSIISDMSRPQVNNVAKLISEIPSVTSHVNFI